MTIIVRGIFNASGNIVIKHDALPVSPVDSVSAGADQTILCSAIVYLEGSVVGGQNNTFLWEQQSGPTVTIINPTQLNAYFVNVPGGDVVVRLWVDKGTVNETFDDTTISRTPNSAGNIAGDDARERLTPYNEDSLTWKYYATVRYATNLVIGPDTTSWPPPYPDTGLGCPDISVTALTVSWDLPVDIYPDSSQEYDDYLLGQYLYATLERYDTGSWVVEGTFIGENGARQAPITAGEVYRIGTFYNYGMPTHVQYTDEFTAIDDGSILYKTAWSNGRIVGDGASTRTVSIDRFVLTQMAPNNDTTTGPVGDGAANETLTVQRFVLTQMAPNNDTTTGPVGDGSGRQAFLVDRNFGNSIGG